MADLKVARTVRIPNLASGILAVDPLLNPHYECVRKEALEWIIRTLGMDDQRAKKHLKADFACLVGLWYPHANPETYRVGVDWAAWVFEFDDLFDNPLEWKNKPMKAAEQMMVMLAILDDTHPAVSPDENPLGHVFQTVWRGFQKTRPSPELQQRLKKVHRQYFYGILGMLDAAHKWSTFSVDEYVALRRADVGCAPCIVLGEWSGGIDLPPAIIEHPSLKAFRHVAIDLTWIANDVLSYKKELAASEGNNLMFVLQQHGYSEQEAMDKADDMLQDCHKRWNDALAGLPTWGAGMDELVSRYVSMCCNVAVGCMRWGLKTGRYLALDEGARVLQTGFLELP